MIKLITDSTCDLPKDILEENNIDVFPLLVTLGDDVFYDGIDIKPKDIYEYVQKTGQLPKTASRSVYDLKEMFEEYTKNGDDVIFCGIGGNLSSNQANAEMARNEMENKEKVHVVDSCNLSLGIGFVLLEGAKAIKQLKTVEEVVAVMNKTAQNIQGSFIVDRLDYLYKGGRCSRFSFSMATFLKIKPRLEVVKGVLANTGKEIGPYKVVLKKYVDYILNKFKKPKKDLCFIAHTKCDEEYLKTVKEYIESKNIFEKVLMYEAGSVITSHCGENTIGMFFKNEEEI